MKDIFIDNNIAKNFTNPVDTNYQKLISWLLHFEESKIECCAHLVLTNKILQEYKNSNRNNFNSQNIILIIGKLTEQRRLNFIENKILKKYKFPTNIEKKICCLGKDKIHLKAILLSHRKIALIIDSKFRNAVNSHPKVNKIKPKAESRPEDLDYENL